MKNRLQTGDIIFRKEDSFLSNRFEQMDGRGFSHIGIIYVKDEEVYVVHIERNNEEGDLKIDSIIFFLKYAVNYKIKRFSMYHNTQIIEKNLIYIIKENPKFDFKFDFSTDKKLYCTELIYKLYQKTYQVNLTKERATFGYYNYISVGSILESSYLKYFH